MAVERVVTCQPDRCGGHAEHERIKKVTREFVDLPFVGVQRYEDEDGTQVALEMRNAACGSTLARRMK